MIKYYPSFRVTKSQYTRGNEFLEGQKPYSGYYYTTFDGKSYTGKNPVEGKNRPLISISEITSPPVNSGVKNGRTDSRTRRESFPIPYYPLVTQSDYEKGFINRYFLKRENDRGYVMEISEFDYADIVNGTANYDVSRLQTTEILWRLTGPLRTYRVSQYDIRSGIVETNERTVLEVEKSFVGIKAYIGGKYDQYARPTK
jgi:hypothetical protein